MSRFGWIALAAAGVVGVIVLATSGTGAIGSDDMPRFVYLGILGAVVAAGILGSGARLGYVARSLAVWALVILAMVGGYQYRYELQDVASRLTAGLIPGSPVSFVDAEGGANVMLEKQPGGHFEARATVDGAPVRVIVDTGATATVLTANDARAAGLDPASLAFNVPVSTANGITMAARAVAGEVAVGAIVRRNLPVLVAEAGALERSLLGMNFLGSLSGYDVRGDRMILRD